MITCCNCGRDFDPISHRFLCPHCKFKSSCCEGAPLPDRVRDVVHHLHEGRL